MKKIMIAFICVMLLLSGCGKQKEPVVELTDAEQFAQDNDISIELAESIENALSASEMPDSIKALKDWEEIEDYADGQRYTAWSYSVKNERYYYMMFYVQDDTVVSIKDRDNGLVSLYEK